MHRYLPNAEHKDHVFDLTGTQMACEWYKYEHDSHFMSSLYTKFALSGFFVSASEVILIARHLLFSGQYSENHEQHHDQKIILSAAH